MSKFKIGDKVKIILNDSGSVNHVGDIGIITEIDSEVNILRVFVSEKHKSDLGNWSSPHEISLVEETEAPVKHNSNKPMHSLIRPEFLTGLAEGLTYGKQKYQEERGEIQNYLKGEGFYYSEIIDSLDRHITAWKSGENIDPESKIHHLSLAAVNLMFLHTYEHSNKGIDDRVRLEKKK